MRLFQSARSKLVGNLIPLWPSCLIQRNATNKIPHPVNRWITFSTTSSIFSLPSWILRIHFVQQFWSRIAFWIWFPFSITYNSYESVYPACYKICLILGYRKVIFERLILAGIHSSPFVLISLRLDALEVSVFCEALPPGSFNESIIDFFSLFHERRLPIFVSLIDKLNYQFKYNAAYRY